MPNTAQQLREALGEIDENCDIAIVVLSYTERSFEAKHLLLTLLDEYEKLEREAEAGRALAEDILAATNPYCASRCGCEQGSKGHDGSCRFIKPTAAEKDEQISDALSAYHTACGKGEGV